MKTEPLNPMALEFAVFIQLHFGTAAAAAMLDGICATHQTPFRSFHTGRNECPKALDSTSHRRRTAYLLFVPRLDSPRLLQRCRCSPLHSSHCRQSIAHRNCHPGIPAVSGSGGRLSLGLLAAAQSHLHPRCNLSVRSDSARKTFPHSSWPSAGAGALELFPGLWAHRAK